MRRIARSVTFAAGIVVTVASMAGAAVAGSADDEAPPSRFQHLPGLENIGGVKPASLALDEKVKVIVRVAGKSVGQHIAEARREGKSLSKEQRAAIRAELKSRQDRVRGDIANLGGEVTTAFQDAYNGLTVRIPLRAVPELQNVDGVESVHPIRTYEIDNTAGVQFINAPGAWTSLGLTGSGIKVAIMDTGVDYTHANFGGPGTAAAFEANDGTVIEPGTFPTAKVVGGFDFVGDDYNASSSDPAEFTPNPDPDPLDCNGHGSHVAGSAAGFGVTADGSTYAGPYNSGIYGTTDFRIGPGVAPDALIYAYRVFGCSGSASEEVIVAALERALEDDVDVVNMSLGSPFGREDEPSAVASNTLAEAGIVVVASAGNSGAGAYITGAPAIATRAISVAAIDASRAELPGATFALSTGESIVAQNSNDAPFAAGTTLPVKVLRNAAGAVSLGCEQSDYVDVAGKLVVTLRGTCARVARAVYGQKAGAAAVVMINTSTAYPPFEGEITGNPDTGEEFLVTIPFFGVRGVLGPSPTDDGDKLVAADGGTVTLTPATVTNPGYKQLASFTSGGPRNVDSAQKPDVTAPGVSVVSTDVGTGFRGTTISGTSMAAPMTAGVAALVTQAHADWSTERIKAAIMNTAEAGPAAFAAGYDPRRAGTGVVQADRAVATVGLATTGNGAGTLSFGYEPLGGAYSETIPLTLQNTGASPITYDLAGSFVGPSRGATVGVSPGSVTVPAGGSTTVDVTMSMAAADVAALPAAVVSNFGALVSVRGVVVATPQAAGDGVYALRVPFMLVPRGLSNVTAGEPTRFTPEKGGPVFTGSVELTNGGIHSGVADTYVWGISDADDVSGAEDAMDVRVAGVQSLPGELLGGDPSDRTLVFAINTYGRWSNASTSEFDVAIDVNRDGEADYFVVGVDVGAVLAGSFDGRFASFIFNAEGELVNAWVADAPMNGSTVLLPTLASDIGITEANSSFSYAVAAFSLIPGGLVDLTEAAGFDAFDPGVNAGDFVPLAPGASTTLELSYDRSIVAKTKALGWLIVTLDDPNGGAQGETIPLKPPGKATGKP